MARSAELIAALALSITLAAAPATASRPVMQKAGLRSASACAARSCTIAPTRCLPVRTSTAGSAAVRCTASARGVEEQGRRELDALIASIQ